MKLPHHHDLQKADRIAALIAGHLKGSLSEAEAKELEEWVGESDENLALFEKLTDEENFEAAIAKYRSIHEGRGAVYMGLKQRLHSKTRKIIGLPVVWIAAAVVLVIVAAALWWWSPVKQNINTQTVAHANAALLPPGGDKAVLTLSDGRTIILDSAAKGALANEGAVSIQQNTEGQIIYEGNDTAMKYNLVSTPRGGQFAIVLGDGTRVWLNAESSLKFPAGFSGSQRQVELTGEAYFEVAKDATHPFRVHILTPLGDGGNIEVLGTHFNVNAYADEGNVKTTLLEGRVRVQHGGQTATLAPGQQAIIGTQIQVVKTEANEAIAWRQGKFLFRNASAQSIGEQLKRWYDVEVEYRGPISQHFNIEADRNLPLPKLLEALQGTAQISFVLDGKKLLVQPATVSR